MKAIQKRTIFLVILGFVLVATIGISVILYNENQNQRLTESQISKLREKYPLCGIETPPTISMIKPSLEQVIESSDSFIYGEVVGDVSTYSVDISTGVPELDVKREENGISNVYEFYGYTIEVIQDTEGIYKKGEEIIIIANVIFKDYNPTLSEGMQVVVPVTKNTENPSQSYFGANGMYYVTEDGYAISAVEEKTLTRSTLSGIKVEKLLKELKK